MLNFSPFSVVVGSILGFLSGLGTGGGSLLILWLTFVVGVDSTIARNINLMFFVPSALIACFFRWKQGRLNFGKILPAIVAGCISAAIFSWLSGIIDSSLFRKAFGLLLIFTGLRELLCKK